MFSLPCHQRLTRQAFRRAERVDGDAPLCVAPLGVLFVCGFFVSGKRVPELPQLGHEVQALPECCLDGGALFLAEQQVLSAGERGAEGWEGLGLGGRELSLQSPRRATHARRRPLRLIGVLFLLYTALLAREL